MANIVVVASFAPLATPSTPPVALCPNILASVLWSTAGAYGSDQISRKGAEPVCSSKYLLTPPLPLVPSISASIATFRAGGGAKWPWRTPPERGNADGD